MSPFWKGWLLTLIVSIAVSRVLSVVAERLRKRCAAQAYHDNHSQATRYARASTLARTVGILSELVVIVTIFVGAFMMLGGYA